MHYVMHAFQWFPHHSGVIFSLLLPVIVASSLSAWYSRRLLRISTYPVPQMSFMVDTQPDDGSGFPVFKIRLTNVGRATTIIVPELYVFVRDPGPDFEPSPAKQGAKKKRRWRQDWYCIYKRILPNIEPTAVHEEILPGKQQRDPRSDYFVGMLLNRFPRFFRFMASPIIHDAPPSGPLTFRLEKTSQDPVPLLIRVAYQLGISGTPSAMTEYEYDLRINLQIIGTPTEQRVHYILLATREIRPTPLAKLRRRFFRRFYDAKDIVEGAPWIQ